MKKGRVMAKKGEEKSFEELMEELENITTKLEKEQISLDESVKIFEEGMNISKECNKKLEEAERRITMLVETKDGFEETDFVAE
jgi:exodeoxyribonuclease VII small subunit